MDKKKYIIEKRIRIKSIGGISFWKEKIIVEIEE